MRLKTIVLSALALILFVGCNEKQIVPDLDSNASYMTVRLVSPADVHTKGSQGGYALGTADEGKIKNAHFYFYDVMGNFVVEGETISDLGTTQQGAGSNIERKTDVTIVLRNVTVLPDQMFVVLNLPVADAAKFPGKTLTEAQAQVTEIYKNTDTSFIMTSTTYRKKDENPPVIFTTRNISGNLKKTEAEAKDHPVNAYVERLAVKGSLTIKDADATLLMPNEVPASFSTVTAPFQGEEKNVTIKINGWGFSNLNKSSYYIKKIDNAWTYAWNWDDYNQTDTWGGHYRSFWAQDANYTDGVYPTNYADLRDEGSGDQITPETASLDYKPYSAIAAQTWRPADYCHENTIAGDLLLAGHRYMNAATNILVAAQMKIATESDYVTLYRFNGVFYTWAQYSDLLAANLNQSYKKNGAIDYTAADFQEPIPTDTTTCTNLYDGEIRPRFTPEAASNSSQEAINYLAGERFTTEVFTEGRMYYSIPIEHFLDPNYDKDPAVPFNVGDFGVVRNHWYQVTVTDIQNVGIGVFNVDEPIVPNYDPSTYYLAATLNILAWQTVTQNIVL